jgi:hypothetical protein
MVFNFECPLLAFLLGPELANIRPETCHRSCRVHRQVL